MRPWLVLSLLLACSTTTRSSPGGPDAPRAATTPRPEAPGTPTVAPASTPPDDVLCQSDGFDFAYPYEEQPGPLRELRCGVGPGTACTDERRAECAGTKLMVCQFGRVGATDCRTHCQEVGDMQDRVFDGGTCRAQGEQASCVCCDVGEPGCEGETARPRNVVPLERGRARAGSPAS